MFAKLLQGLEHPLHPLLGPTLWGLEAWGMWQSNKRLSRILYYLLHISATLFVFSQYVELWIIRSHLEQALRNLSVTMLSTVCVIKVGTFVLWQKYWKSVIHYVSKLERRQLSTKDSVTKRIIGNYTKYSRSVTYFYWCLVTITVFTVILAPLAIVITSKENLELMKNGSKPYPEIMSSWAPFEKSRGYGYWVLVVEHSLICFYGGGIVANYDTNAVVLMSFFAGQLKLLKVNCARLFGEEQKRLDYRVAMKRIRECHAHHLLIVQNAKMLNSLLSPVMFLYIIICSLMICASAVQLTKDGTTTMQQIWIAEYLIALIAQLFLYCWHSSIVLDMVFYIVILSFKERALFREMFSRLVFLAINTSLILVSLMSHGTIAVYHQLHGDAPSEDFRLPQSIQVEDGVYASAWWAQDRRVRRSVALLAGQLRKDVVFTAGPFNKLTVSTFVAILKGSYSYYTILSKKAD